MRWWLPTVPRLSVCSWRREQKLKRWKLISPRSANRSKRSRSLEHRAVSRLQVETLLRQDLLQPMLRSRRLGRRPRLQQGRRLAGLLQRPRRGRRVSLFKCLSCRRLVHVFPRIARSNRNTSTTRAPARPAGACRYPEQCKRPRIGGTALLWCRVYLPNSRGVGPTMIPAYDITRLSKAKRSKGLRL